MSAKPKIDARSWNAALDAAAALIGQGYDWIKRPYDPKSRSFGVEVRPASNKKPRGDYIEWCHVAPDDEGKDIAAINSLRRSEQP
jgi:hypothetical protein